MGCWVPGPDGLDHLSKNFRNALLLSGGPGSRNWAESKLWNMYDIICMYIYILWYVYRYRYRCYDCMLDYILYMYIYIYVICIYCCIKSYAHGSCTIQQTSKHKRLHKQKTAVHSFLTILIIQKTGTYVPGIGLTPDIHKDNDIA